jgi:hypothetical protein
MVAFPQRLFGAATCACLLVAVGTARVASSQIAVDPADDGVQVDIAAKILAAQEQGGPYAQELIDPLMSLSLLYQENGQHALASAVAEQASQVVRANYGLRSLEQAPMIRQRILSEEASGNFEQAWKLEQALLTLAATNRNDLRAAPIFREIGDKRIELFEHYSAGERPPQVILGCYYGWGYGMGSCTAGSKRVASRAILLDAQSNYTRAIGVLVRQQQYSSAELRELELELIRSSYLYTSDYQRGRQSLARLVSYGVANGEPLVQRAAALIEVADWDLLFEQRESALDTYEQTYAFLEQKGTDAAELDAIFSPEIPIALPTFLGNPLISSSPEQAAGHIDVAFELTRYGATRKVNVVAATSNATDEEKARLVRIVNGTRFRPRATDGEFARSTPVVVRYYFE